LSGREFAEPSIRELVRAHLENVLKEHLFCEENLTSRVKYVLHSRPETVQWFLALHFSRITGEKIQFSRLDDDESRCLKMLAEYRSILHEKFEHPYMVCLIERGVPRSSFLRHSQTFKGELAALERLGELLDANPGEDLIEQAEKETHRWEGSQGTWGIFRVIHRNHSKILSEAAQ
jgi:hypothetical protein